MFQTVWKYALQHIGETANLVAGQNKGYLKPQVAFMAKPASLIVAIQIGFVFDMSMAFAFDFHIQFLIAAPEFKVGIVGFDFGFHQAEALAAGMADNALCQLPHVVAAQVEFGFKFAIVLRFCLHYLRTARSVDFAWQGIGCGKRGETGQHGGQQQSFLHGNVLLEGWGKRCAY